MPVRLCWSSGSNVRPGLPSNIEHELVIDGPRHLGSAPGDEIRIDREGISARHLAFEPRADGVWLRAISAAWLDGERVTGSVRIPDTGGLLRVGAVELALRWEPAGCGTLDDSPVMRALLDAAPAGRDLLIEGEPGAGRRALARAIHERDRLGAPYVAVDCRSFYPDLLDIVLLGTRQGGNPPPPRPADTHYWGGMIAAAADGTLVLSAIDALPREAQAWLARILAVRPPANHTTDGRQAPFAARVIATAAGALPLAPALDARLVQGERLRVPALRDRAADLGPLLRAFGAGDVGAPLRGRLARLRWRRNAAQLRGVAARIAQVGADEAVAEAELLAAIEDEPAADGARLVYGDLLVARGDPRGELIQVQCRLADPATPSDARPGLAVRERALLDTHGAAWVSPLVDGYRIKAAALSRGFIEAVRADRDVLHILDFVLEHAPLLGDLHLDPALHPDYAWPARLESPLLARLHTLRASCPRPADELAAELAACPHLAGLRTLALAKAAEGAPAGMSILGGEGARVLAGSRHTAGVTSLVIDGGLLPAAAIAGLLGPAAWTLRRLVLERLQLGDAEPAGSGARELEALEILVRAPGLRRLAVLALSEVPLGDAAVPVLARVRGPHRLELRGCGLSPEAAARLAAALPGVDLDIA